MSGAGPTVLIWTYMDSTPAVKAKLQQRCEGWADVMRVPFEPHGAVVL